jgi:hypothetical protein
LLGFITLVGLFAVSPVLGRWVQPANASSAPMTGGAETVNAPANDNDDEDENCDSGNPRKQKKCHFNEANADNDNDDGDVADQPPTINVAVSDYDPDEGDTINFTVFASGNDLDQIWWWIPDYINSDDNDNDDSFGTDTHTTNCDGNDSCSTSTDLHADFPDTFTIHAKARDRQGRESGEFVTEVRVHD